MNNFESAADLPVSHVVRSFDKGLHAAAAVALTYARGVYDPVARKRPHVYDPKKSEAERNAAADEAKAQRRVADSLKLELKKAMSRQASLVNLSTLAGA